METPLTFEAFWTWLNRHPNCIVRAGTPDSVLYDDEDLHWYLATDDDDNRIVQLLRGKRILGELVIVPERVAYVQEFPAEQQDEHSFELVAEGGDEREVAYFFVFTHGFGTDEAPNRPRIH